MFINVVAMYAYVVNSQSADGAEKNGNIISLGLMEKTLRENFTGSVASDKFRFLF